MTLLRVLAGIDVAPVTQRANLSESEYATFYCRATTSRNTKWSIHMNIYDSRNYTDDSSGYRFREVTVEVQESGDVVHDMYLEVPTTVQNNGTSVKCWVFEDVQISSPPAMLIVQGKLSLPVIYCNIIIISKFNV